MTVRKAERRDLGALGSLGAMLMRTHYEFDRNRFLAPGSGSERGYAAFLGGMLESEDECIFVAEIDGQIAGYVFAALEPLSWKELRGPAGFIHDIAVSDAQRRTGLARELMRAAIDWLRDRGAPRAMLWTASPNAAARELFKSLGFRETMIEMTVELT